VPFNSYEFKSSIEGYLDLRVIGSYGGFFDKSSEAFLLMVFSTKSRFSCSLSLLES
jgi:hypothetical protein